MFRNRIIKIKFSFQMKDLKRHWTYVLILNRNRVLRRIFRSKRGSGRRLEKSA